MLRSLLGLRLALTSAGIALIAVAFAAAVDYPEELVCGTALWGAGIVIQMAALTLGIPLQSQLRFGWVSALDLLRQLVTVVLLIVALILARRCRSCRSSPWPSRPRSLDPCGHAGARAGRRHCAPDSLASTAHAGARRS